MKCQGGYLERGQAGSSLLKAFLLLSPMNKLPKHDEVLEAGEGSFFFFNLDH